MPRNNPTAEEIIDLIATDGFAFAHTAMRKAIDSDTSSEIWKLMSELDSDEIASFNQFMIACLVGFDSDLYKQAVKKIYPNLK